MSTSILTGILWRDWKTIKKQNKVSLRHAIDHIDISMRSRWNSKMANRENELFAQKVNSVVLENDPIFILGHWRSGTTMLHNYLCQDNQFAYPNLFETYNPHTFLYFLPKIKDRLNRQKSESRPMDNVKVRFDSPAEDEFALAISSLCSPLLGWVFPHQRGNFDRFLAFDEVDKDELKRWEKSLLTFVKKLTFLNNKQVILKSPQHTSRIKHLLRLFPNAKFINLYRNPYRVFQSTKKLYDTTVLKLALQNSAKIDEDYIIKNYVFLYDNYFRNKSLIPKGNLLELSFENFVNDPVTILKDVYTKFDLKGFDDFEPKLRAYHKAMRNYQRNNYTVIPAAVKRKINKAWERLFEEWNYYQI